MKNIDIVCGLNASRSQFIQEFLRDKYRSNPEININSAGLNVDKFAENDKRTLYTKEMAGKTDIILVSDHFIFYRIRHDLLENDENQIKRVHNMRIPDVFHIHKNAALDESVYEQNMQKIKDNPEFIELVGYIKALSPEEASALMEAIYIKELYTAHLYPKLRQDKKYPFELLHKTLEFRFPKMSELISKIK